MTCSLLKVNSQMARPERIKGILCGGYILEYNLGGGYIMECNLTDSKVIGGHLHVY